ncbi:hypothetical protein N6H05_07530 [Sphingobium sp. WTD-1]|uniref:hypothetical protein n=1 Tax=Sphingobium sp. WTD-1 TaxID=2979467 RepID=UPI0024DE5F4E|nr:hypothetical protein [Sphingobium sp. WTD-1]WIA57639.1 hypothetical protein N6H05_07530 [Sphingobium sp. WTD-1]
MIQIVLWMLCVYLIFKGKELVFIAAASSHESREHNIESAKRWARAAYVAAGIFFILSIAQGNSMPDIPRSY